MQFVENTEVLIIKWLQSFSNPFLDNFFIFISLFGSIYFAIIVLSYLYTFNNKENAFKFFIGFICSVLFVTTIKIAINRLRPYEKFPFDIRLIGKPETSASFPSGHSQTAGYIYTYLLINVFKKIWPKIIFGLIFALVIISRMYLGVHYLSDILVGSMIGICLFFITDKILKKVTINILIVSLWLAVISFVVIIIISILCFNTLLSWETSAEILISTSIIFGFAFGIILEKVIVNDLSINNKKGAKMNFLFSNFIFFLSYILLNNYLIIHPLINGLIFFAYGFYITFITPLLKKIFLRSFPH